MTFPIDPESAALTAGSLESLTRSYQRSATAYLAAEVNRLLIVALGNATGFEAPSPYDFIGRLAKNKNAQGITVYFDKVAILWIGQPQTGFSDGSMTVKLPYCMLSGCPGLK